MLDLCAGGGSLAILAARVFPNARIEAVDVSPDALEVAERNVEEHGLQDRIALKRGDLFAPVKDARFDLILAEPALCRRGDDRGAFRPNTRPSRRSPMPAARTGSTSCAGS